MRELSLFSGGGGGLLGTHWLLGWRAVGYVEWEDYPQRLLAARIKDGLLPDAPIFGDIRAFNRDGYADAYQGMVDVISAGFPCQPFSVAGRRRGDDDERNQWPATVECIRVVRPRYAFLENVPGLLTSGYFGTILSDLSESGYDARWRVLSAAELGAPHKRDRLWIVAYADGLKRINTQKRYEKIRLFKRMDAQEVWNRGCQSGILGNDNALPSRVDRLKAIGNGQVPAVAARAWLELTGGLI